jgi:hypothetical protein
MDDKLTTIFTAATPLQARLLQNRLDDEGIQAYLVNDALQAAVGEVPFGWTTAVRVAVSSAHAEQARAIAEGFESRLSARTVRGLRREQRCGSNFVAGLPRMPPAANRRVPVVRHGRHAISRGGCRAGRQPGGQDQAERWLCPTCDEPVEGRYLRWCEWCNHDFGSGVHVPAPVVREVENNLNPRLVFSALALAGLVVLLLLYFAIVLAR